MSSKIKKEWLAKYLSGDTRLKEERHGIFRLNYDKKRLEFAVQTSDKAKAPLIIVSYPIKFLKEVKVIEKRQRLKKKKILVLELGEPPNIMAPAFSFSLNDLEVVRSEIESFKKEIEDIGKTEVRKSDEADIIETFANLLKKPVEQIQQLLEDVRGQLLSFAKTPKDVKTKIIETLEPKNEYKIKEIELSSRKVRYYDSELPSKTVLILLSPIGGSIEDFFPLLKNLKDFRVIILGQRGYGTKNIGDKDYKLKNYVQDLKDFLNYLGNENEFILAAHSLFSAILIEEFINHDYPEITKFIMISGAHCAPSNLRKGAKALPPPQLWAPFKGQVKKIAPKILFGSKADPQIVNSYVSKAFEVPDKVYHQVFRNFLPKYEYSKQIQQLNKPILLLWGDEDQIITPDIRDQMIDLISSRIVSYKMLQGGHMIFLEKPDQVANEIRRFILRKGREIQIE
ncbi:MAG: alpha/beta fold hydrolase [Candidatus Hodarchaeales archaeon]